MLLALVVDRLADSLSSSVTWTPGGEFKGTRSPGRPCLRPAFAEVSPWCGSSGNWMGAVEWVSKVCESAAKFPNSGPLIAVQQQPTFCPMIVHKQ